MKKTLLTVAALLSLVVSTNAASFVFRTYDSADFSMHIIFDGRTTMPAEGPNVVAQVYMSLTGQEGSFEAVGPVAALLQGAGAGFVEVAGAQTVNTVNDTTVFGGDMVFYRIAAWDNQGGAVASFEEATLRGMSGNATYTLGGTPQGGGTAVPALPMNTFDSFTITPEPSVFVLGLLGGIGFLFRRRR